MDSAASVGTRVQLHIDTTAGVKNLIHGPTTNSGVSITPRNLSI